MNIAQQKIQTFMGWTGSAEDLNTYAGVEPDQDWQNGETTWTFSDGSKIIQSGPLIYIEHNNLKRLITMPENKKLIFDSKKSVIDFLRSVSGLTESPNSQFFYPTGTYYLRHGEYSTPEYTPRRYKDGWSIHVEHHFYAGTLNAPASGRVNPFDFFN